MLTKPFSILYLTINENINSLEEGVSKKLQAKIAAIKTICPQSLLLNASINLYHNDTLLNFKNEFITSIDVGVKDANKGYLNKNKSDNLFYRKLASYIKNNIKFDRIIFRYPYATMGLKYFTETFHNKIVFEHNTKELEELQVNISNKKYAPFSLSPSAFFYWFQEKKQPLFAEKYLSRKIMPHAYAGSCVTSEIAEYEQKRNPGYKTFVSSNFYDVSKVELSTSSYNENQQILTLGMIVTSTAEWYGLERLFRSFSIVQDYYKLIIAGIDKNDQDINKLLLKNKIITNIEFLGKINKDQLKAFYNSVHVCFGSLGLYNINLKYASTLKVKESVAYGIPVVIGYNEEDFITHDEFSPYYLQLKNDSSTIDFNLIKKFVSQFYANNQSNKNLRDLALKYLDVKVKINALLEKIKPI
jgi:hypothetical protein